MFWDTTNYFLTNKQHCVGLMLQSLWLSVYVWSHGYNMTSGNHHLIPAIKMRSVTAPTQVALWEHQWKQEKAKYHLAEAACTHIWAQSSQSCTVKCFSGCQGSLSSIHHSTVTGRWQTAVRMFLLFTGDSRFKQRSLAASPISKHTLSRTLTLDCALHHLCLLTQHPEHTKFCALTDILHF